MVTAFIIVVNVFGFLLELMRGDAFVMQWSAIPAQIIWPDFNSYIFKKRLAE